MTARQVKVVIFPRVCKRCGTKSRLILNSMTLAFMFCAIFLPALSFRRVKRSISSASFSAMRWQRLPKLMLIWRYVQYVPQLTRFPLIWVGRLLSVRNSVRIFRTSFRAISSMQFLAACHVMLRRSCLEYNFRCHSKHKKLCEYNKK